MDVLQTVRENEQYEMREILEHDEPKGNRKAFLTAVVVAVIIALFALPVLAQETDVPILKDKVLVNRGVCHITAPTASFWVPCERYLDAEGNEYIALYADGKVQVVKRKHTDGTMENVYVRKAGYAI